MLCCSVGQQRCWGVFGPASSARDFQKVHRRKCCFKVFSDDYRHRADVEFLISSMNTPPLDPGGAPAHFSWFPVYLNGFKTMLWVFADLIEKFNLIRWKINFRSFLGERGDAWSSEQGQLDRDISWTLRSRQRSVYRIILFLPLTTNLPESD